MLTIEILFLVIIVGDNESNDVFDDTATKSTNTETAPAVDSIADVDRSRHHHHRRAWNNDAVRTVRSTDDDLRSSAADEDHRVSNWVSASRDGDVERRKSGLQRRRLGQLPLKRRLAIDLPDLSSTATRGTHCHLEQPADAETMSVVGRPANFAAGTHHKVVLDSLWNTLDDFDCQLYVAFIVAVATLAAALNVPPAWLILAVAGLSLLHFVLEEQRHEKPR